MSLFLLKPHVTGPEGQITSPDVIVDRMFVDGALSPVNALTHEAWQQAASDETGKPAYGIMAIGGGALILPVVVLGSGAVIASRKAWRLNNLDAHVGDILLNGTALSTVGLPAHDIEAMGGSGDTLPRGYLLVRTMPVEALNAELSDPQTGRTLSHKVVLEDMASDPWADARPKPRYSVGPTMKDVPHYI